MRRKDESLRRGVVRAAFSVAAALSVVALSGDASAFCRSTTCDPRISECPLDDDGCPGIGAPLTWRKLPLEYRFHRDGTSKLDNDLAREAIRAAFDTWSQARCSSGRRTSLRFREGAVMRVAKPKGRRVKANEPFGIFFQEEEWPYDDGDESLALTNQGYGQINGYINYAHIEINTATQQYSLGAEDFGIDLQSVMVHEVGHYIGLAHSRVPDSIMVARYCESADRCGQDIDAARALAADDIAAVCALYPPDGMSGVAWEPDTSGCAVTVAARGDGDGRFVAALGIAAAALTALRRRRARSAP